MMKHDFSLLLSNLIISLNFKTVSTHVLLILLLTGCSKNTAQYFSNAPAPTMKMQHKTTILNAKTDQLAGSMVASSSEVNFEYELITRQ
jgi:PBP1b-binding outer membrane lipoprotein LpoB